MTGNNLFEVNCLQTFQKIAVTTTKTFIFFIVYCSLVLLSNPGYRQVLSSGFTQLFLLAMLLKNSHSIELYLELYKSTFDFRH